MIAQLSGWQRGRARADRGVMGRGAGSDDYLGACPRIESLLRKSHFGPFLRSFSLNMSNYTQSAPQTTCRGVGSSPQMTAKWLSLATTSILGQAPSMVRTDIGAWRHYINIVEYYTSKSYEDIFARAGNLIRQGPRRSLRLLTPLDSPHRSSF
jgi:hypothetical protein